MKQGVGGRDPADYAPQTPVLVRPDRTIQTHGAAGTRARLTRRLVKPRRRAHTTQGIGTRANVGVAPPMRLGDEYLLPMIIEVRRLKRHIRLGLPDCSPLSKPVSLLHQVFETQPTQIVFGYAR